MKVKEKLGAGRFNKELDQLIKTIRLQTPHFDFRAIGSCLAQLKGIHVVTGGFYGVGDTVGRSYHDERIKMKQPSNLWHILPHSDVQVCFKHVWCRCCVPAITTC